MKFLASALVTLAVGVPSFATQVCFNIDATNFGSGQNNVEECGPQGTNLVTIPPGAQFRIYANRGATCFAKAVSVSPKGTIVRINYGLSIDSGQSCQLFFTNGVKKAVVGFQAIGS